MLSQRKSDKRSVAEIAKQIFEDFDLNQSITIWGYQVGINGNDLEIKGMEVIKELDRLDTLHNFHSDGKKMRRKRQIVANSVGGYVAHKIWRYKQDTADGVPRVAIWRIQ